MVILMFVTPCFPRTAVISSAVTKANFLLLITSLEVFNRLRQYALHLVVEAFHFEDVPVLHYLLQSLTGVGNVPKGKPIRLG